MDHEAIREEALENALKDKDFAWRYRVVESVSAKAARLPTPEERRKLAKTIDHLDRWCDDFLKEEFESIIEDNMDPYTLRGLRRSDF